MILHKKHENSVVYCVKGLESSVIKYYHHDHLILFKEKETNIKVAKHVIDLPSWHNTRNVTGETEAEYVVKESVNKVVTLWYGETNNISADYKLNVSTVTTEKAVLNNLKEAKKTGATSAIITLSTQHESEECVRPILTAVRRTAENKKWERIVVVVKSSKMYNMMLQLFASYFPKQIATRNIETWVPESDDENEDSDIEIIMNMEQVDEQENEQSQSESDEDSEASESDSSESSSSSSESENSDNEESESDEEDEEPVLRRSNRVRRAPEYFADYVMGIVTL